MRDDPTLETGGVFTRFRLVSGSFLHKKAFGQTGLDAEHRPIRGFTLLEVIVSMTILTMLIILVTNLFQQVSDSWNIGVDRAEALGAGRGVLELMTRELSTAVCDSRFVFVVVNNTGVHDGNETYYVDRPDRISFVSFSGEPSGEPGSERRAVREVCYYVDLEGTRFNLMRSIYTHELVSQASEHCYGTGPQFRNWAMFNQYMGSSAILLEDVADFQLFPYAKDGTLVEDYNSWENGNSLPAYIDIYLEVLGRVNAKRASKLAGLDQEEYVNRTSRRFTTRVFFINTGWKK